MTFLQFKTAVKLEGRVGDTNLDDLIKDITQDELSIMARSHPFDELLVLEHEIATTAGQNFVALPSDFLRLRAEGKIYYKDADDRHYLLGTKRNHRISSEGRVPRGFVISNSRIYFYPSDEVATGEKLIIDYYKVPTTIAGDATVIIPDRIVPALKQAVLARIAAFNDSARTVYHQKEAQKKLYGSI